MQRCGDSSSEQVGDVWRTSATPTDVLAEIDVEELDALPEERAYQLVGRDFVLIDVQSNLVVDVIQAVLRLY